MKSMYLGEHMATWNGPNRIWGFFTLTSPRWTIHSHVVFNDQATRRATSAGGHDFHWAARTWGAMDVNSSRVHKKKGL